MEAREFARLQEQAEAEAVGLTERHVSCEQRLTYLASAVRKRKTCGREAAAVSHYNQCFLAAEP